MVLSINKLLLVTQGKVTTPSASDDNDVARKPNVRCHLCVFILSGCNKHTKYSNSLLIDFPKRKLGQPTAINKMIWIILVAA